MEVGGGRMLSISQWDGSSGPSGESQKRPASTLHGRSGPLNNGQSKHCMEEVALSIMASVNTAWEKWPSQ